MRKLIFLFALVALVMQSCSTGNMFTKKRYAHLKWIDHNTTLEENNKSESTENENKAVVKSDMSSTAQVKTVTPINEPATTANSSASVPAEKTAAASNTKTNATKPVVKALEKVNPMHAVEKIKNTKPARKIASAVSSAKEGSTGELLLMAVLIACAIILFIFLDGLLRGVLSLILIIFLLLVLLRYFGVI